MPMTKRIQIPIDEPELAQVKAAAQKAGQPLAEWARDILREESRRVLEGPDLSPDQALEQLFGSEAPVHDLVRMLEDSVQGRLA